MGLPCGDQVEWLSGKPAEQQVPGGPVQWGLAEFRSGGPA
jgi:hypothetical protein